MESTKVTPMMQQYLQIKERYRDAILFFRLGDFYEMFFEDAHTASKILDIALTSRNKSDETSVPLCGVPYHSAEPYIQKLLDAGHKVAVCEQVEDPATAKGVVKREVVRVITPGTVTAAEALDAHVNNFLAAVSKGEGGFGLAVTDITTGEFRFTEIAGELALFDELSRIQPSELLLGSRETRLRERLYKEFPLIHFTAVSDEAFSDAANSRVTPNAAPASEEFINGLRAASAIMSYLEANASESLKLLRDLESYAVSHHLVLDEATRANLELVANSQGDRKGSLLAILDCTLTSMGARRLRQWLLYPLLDEQVIRERHDGVQELVEHIALRQELKAGLAKMQDLERLAGRVVSGSAVPKDLVAIRDTLRGVSQLRQQLNGIESNLLLRVRDGLADLPEVVGLVERAIVDDPPFALKEGGFIRAGFDAELDEIRGMRAHARDWIARFEASERRRTGIQSLKVRYNRVFGYYIEVTNSNLKSVPADYLRKQTLTNGERYITPELKEYETKVLNAESLIEKLEATLLARVREQVAGYYPALKAMSNALAILDVSISLAEVAEGQHFVRPQIDNGVCLSIREGRHPVVEAAVGRGKFVPNDCAIDPESQQIILLTGPNMAGKSTYMRQVALIVILAQMGSFVPCAEARIGVVDRIFTRIGAADSLARGESTFMVEMKETANILHHATRRSLILLDEVGRGTSTFDGISIAWAVAESLHDAPARPRTLFATHYHELTDLAQTKERIKNYNFAVKEWRGEIIFLRNLIEGATSHSYGIHVARLAGMPADVIARAKEILARLDGSQDGRGEGFKSRGRVAGDSPAQMGLFNAEPDPIREQLLNLDVTRMTPMEAMNVLHKLTEQAKK
ncbi:MAG TPA: DNA mismatch repair protein MutS [Candidatus Binatia bacterium]|jgi:DNA mismatch repair protein MutS|nr:DNA mismatch repair protein MutS [Candidatus Binatia bacterium]